MPMERAAPSLRRNALVKSTVHMPCSDGSRWACQTSGVNSRFRNARTSSRNAASSAVSFKSIDVLAYSRQDASGFESDVVRLVDPAQSGENVVGVLAEQRRAAVLDAETVHLPRQAKLAMRPRGRMIDGDHTAMGVELRVIQQLIAAHDRTGRHARGL